MHSGRGYDVLAAFGVDETKLRVVPHPVFPAPVERHDDGATVLALGTIRPYKGLPDAVDAVLRANGARLLVAGDPRIPLDELRRRAGRRAEWRLGYLDAGELARAVAESTVAVFPYRAELDQSGALLQVPGCRRPRGRLRHQAGWPSPSLSTVRGALCRQVIWRRSPPR